MRFYRGQHRHYCGIDLHARTMYPCILDHDGTIVLHQRIPCRRDAFLRAVAPYREDLVHHRSAEPAQETKPEPVNRIERMRCSAAPGDSSPLDRRGSDKC